MTIPDGRAATRPGSSRPSGAAIILSLALSSGAALGAQSGPISLEGAVDWSAREARVAASADARALALNPPSGRARGEALLERELPGLMRGALLGLLVDSRTTLGDALASGDYPAEAFDAVVGAAARENARFAPDMSAFLADYRVSLQDIAAPLVRHSRASAPTVLLGYAPVRAFSGILVFAKGRLPVRGERGEAALRPCLFPRVWTEDMEIVLERNTVKPDAVRRWGVAGYAEDDGSEPWEARAGDDPLRIMAVAVFGSNRTDVVISREDALRVLSSENRALLAEGRVVILVESASSPISIR